MDAHPGCEGEMSHTGYMGGMLTQAVREGCSPRLWGDMVHPGCEGKMTPPPGCEGEMAQPDPCAK